MRDTWFLDWQTSERLPVYTRANAGEVLPDPASPLGWTLTWEPAIVMGWRDAQVSFGTFTDDEIPHERPPMVGLFGGRIYINASAARLFGVRAPGLSAEMIDFIYFGEHPDVPPYVPHPDDESPEATERLGAMLGWVMTTPDLPELREDRTEADAVRAGRPNLELLSDVELVERARSFVPLMRKLFERHLTITAGAGIGPGALGAIAEAVGDPTLAMRLVAGIGDVDSALPSYELWELSRIVRGSPVLTAMFSEGVDGLASRITNSDDPRAIAFLSRFDEFIALYGSRGPNEWDIRSDTWETKPQLALTLVDRMRLAQDAETPRRRHDERVNDREQLTAQVAAALAGNEEALGTFHAALQSSRLFLAGRERTKTNIIKVLHEVRMAVAELGRRHGYTLAEVSMITADELDAFAADPASFAATIAERSEQYAELFELDPPFILQHGAVPPLSQWPRVRPAGAAVADSGEVLTGVPGCPGTATGRAVVVMYADDPAALEPGDVLIAPITDPAWTPLFVPAAAVVVNVGAQVSHAVIVSRELGIPCVVSVKDATARIPHGATVTVDGTNGTVTIH
jgi:rifampicin phosphotransferase